MSQGQVCVVFQCCLSQVTVGWCVRCFSAGQVRLPQGGVHTVSVLLELGYCRVVCRVYQCCLS